MKLVEPAHCVHALSLSKWSPLTMFTHYFSIYLLNHCQRLLQAFQIYCSAHSLYLSIVFEQVEPTHYVCLLFWSKWSPLTMFAQ